MIMLSRGFLTLSHTHSLSYIHIFLNIHSHHFLRLYGECLDGLVDIAMNAFISWTQFDGNVSQLYFS